MPHGQGVESVNGSHKVKGLVGQHVHHDPAFTCQIKDGATK